MPYRLQVRIEGETTLPRKLLQQHRRQQSNYARFWRGQVVAVVANKAPEKPLEFSKVTIEMWRKGNEPDPENLAFCAKPLLDGLQPAGVRKYKGRLYPLIGCGVIADDRKTNFKGGRAEVIYHRARRGTKPHIIITVEEVDP